MKCLSSASLLIRACSDRLQKIVDQTLPALRTAKLLKG
jgi:hypothetical protein